MQVARWTRRIAADCRWPVVGNVYHPCNSTVAFEVVFLIMSVFPKKLGIPSEI
jgi:hypothetical protein